MPKTKAAKSSPSVNPYSKKKIGVKAGRSYMIPYVVKVTKTFGHKGYQMPLEFKVQQAGRPNAANLEKWVDKYNTSMEPGGVNQHLGSGAMILEAELIDQKTGKVIAKYKMKNPPSFVAWSVIPTLDVVAEELERRKQSALAMQVDEVAQGIGGSDAKASLNQVFVRELGSRIIEIIFGGPQVRSEAINELKYMEKRIPYAQMERGGQYAKEAEALRKAIMAEIAKYTANVNFSA